jgi:hypothetical protein
MHGVFTERRKISAGEKGSQVKNETINTLLNDFGTAPGFIGMQCPDWIQRI